MRRVLTALFSAALLLAGSVAHAQTVADLANLTGSDRAARLIAGAKKESTLTLYSSAPVEVMTAVTNGFAKKYGVKVSLWRGASEQILQRAMAESRGGRFVADVMETAGTDMEAASREKLFEPIRTPAADALIPEAYVPNRPWIVSRLSVFVIAYNTRAVRGADAPKSYSDLLDPKWKGKIGVEADDNNWLMAASEAMGGEAGLTLFRDMVATNGVSVRKGHTLLSQMVASGEVPLSLDSYINEVIELKKAGAPIEAVYAAPVVAMPTAIAAFKRAPHPHAALLFMDYLLSEEGQAILAAHNIVPAHPKFQRLPPGVKLVFMDVGKYLTDNAKWVRTFRDIFVTRAR